MDQEKYTLKWKWQGYPDHLRGMMQEMMTSENFTDVTLVTDDKKAIKAHRSVLSACSPVFTNIFQLESPNSHPVLYLRGIQYSEMESILQFMYLGEAKFYKERMDEFILVAKNLEVKELSKGVEHIDDMIVEATQLKIEKIEIEGNLNRNDTNSTMIVDKAEILDDNTNKHQAKFGKQVSQTSEYYCKLCDKLFSGGDQLWQHKISIHYGVKHACHKCDKQFTKQANLTAHIRSKHEGVGYACNQCDYQATQQNNLKTHILSVHEGLKYGCNHCDKQFSQQNNLRTHIQSEHEGVMYACKQCDKQYTKQIHRTRHIQSVHQGVKYACNQCDFRATRQDSLAKHIQRKH